MGILKDFLARANARKQRLKEYEDNDRIVGSVEERKKTHNERELIKVLEEEKQRYIKEALVWEEKKRQLLEKKKSRDMMRFNPEFFNNDNILHEKNMFLRGGGNGW